MTTPGGWSPTSGYMLPAGVGASGGTGLSGFAGTTEADWRAWVESQHAPHWDGLGDPIEVMKALVNAVVSALKGNFQPFIDLIGEVPILGDIVKGAANFLSGGRLINLGQLTAAPVNLIAGGFDSLDSVAEAEGWSWDPSDGYGSPGCAMRTLDGEPGLLFSPVAAEVEEGKTYDASCRMKGVDVFPSGASVRFYDADHQHIGTAGLAAVEGLSPGWCLIAASDIPAPTGARWAYFVLEDHGSAGPGELRWDDAGIWSVQTSLPQQVIAGLTDALSELGDDVAAALAWIKDLIEKLTGRARATIEDAIADALAFGSQLKTILSGGTVASPLPNLAGSAVREAQTMIQQIAAIANGDPVTPVNGVVQAFKDGWSGLSSLTAGVESWIQDLIDAILRAIRKVPVVGGSLADIIAEVGGLNDRTDSAQQQAEAVQAGIVEGWTGGSTSGVDLDVYDTMGAIRALVGGDGYTRVNVTSTTTLTKPAGVTEVIVVGIAAGQNGSSGSKVTSNGGGGGQGGQGGGHKVQALDASGFSALHVNIGVPGNPILVRANSSVGPVLMDVHPGATGAMATPFGYTPSNSQAGGGGGGGGGGRVNADYTNGAGGSGVGGGMDGLSASGGGGASGGTGGTGGTGGSSASAIGGSNGGAGGSNSPSMTIPCGGGGGAGGPGGSGNNMGKGGNGTAGGPGGFPGGGGGGGGGSGAGNAFGGSGGAGSGGAGGSGLAIIFYR